MKKQDKYELSFRRPMAVTEAVLFARDPSPYPRCPRCHLTMDREYVSFCDRCGQKLDWSFLDEAATILPQSNGAADKEGEG